MAVADTRMKTWHLLRDSSPVPLAVYRVVVFGAIGLHFVPFVFAFDRTFGPAAFRTSDWDPKLFALGQSLPTWCLGGMVALGYTGVVLALAGVRMRFASGLTFVGFYSATSFNAVFVNTLALTQVWAILTVWVLGGGGDRVITAARNGQSVRGAVAPSWTRRVIGYQIVIGIAFSGVEKIASGWLHGASMTNLMSFPSGHLVRHWVVQAVPAQYLNVVGRVSSVAVVLWEVCVPLFVAFRPARGTVVTAWLVFFGAIGAVLEVPPLFLGTYGAAVLLLVDDEWWNAKLAVVAARIRNRRRDAAFEANEKSS